MHRRSVWRPGWRPRTRALQQDRELISAETRDRVLGPDGRDESPTHFHEILIASRVAEGVVDALEVVAVQVQDAVLLVAGIGGGALHPVAEEVPVGEAGERVVKGLVGQLLLELVAVADISHVEDDPGDCGVIEAIGQLHPRMTPFASRRRRRASTSDTVPPPPEITRCHAFDAWSRSSG